MKGASYGLFRGLAAYTAVVKILLISRSLDGCNEISYMKGVGYGLFKGLATYTAVVKIVLTARSLSGCCEISFLRGSGQHAPA